MSPRLIGTLASMTVAFAGCHDAADEPTPDLEGAIELDGKADGAPSSSAYRELFSPGLLKPTRPSRIPKGISSATLGFVNGVGCHVQREDTWRTRELLIPLATTFAVYAEPMNFIRFSTGQVGFAMRLHEYPHDENHVPLKLYCWGDEMPTPEAARDALLVGSYALRMDFTSSGPPPYE